MLTFPSPHSHWRGTLWIAGNSAACTAFSAVAQQTVPVQFTEIPPARAEQRGNVTFIDFGKDAFGTLEILFPNGAPDTSFNIRLGEKLAADGSIDRHPGGSISYVQASLATQSGQTKFRLQLPPKKGRPKTSVQTPPDIGEVDPFRFAEIEAQPGALDGAKVFQLELHAPFDPQASDFVSSDSTLNGVWDLCEHTMDATSAFGVYIDGERERTPYEADAYIAMMSHYAVDLDPREARATFDYLLQHPTWPTEWSLFMPMIAYEDYMATGDPQLASANFDALKAKLFMDKAGGDGLLRVNAIVDWPASERDNYNNGQQGRQLGPDVNTVANAFYYHSLQCMARLAAALGRADDNSQLSAKVNQVYQSFNSQLFDTAQGTYIDGVGSNHASLHANMFPLAFGLVPPDRVQSVANFVASRGMACSVYGAQFLLEGLYLAGKSDAALALMTAHTDRSWAHMLDLGSTMTLEAWDPSVKPNLTWNHAWGAAPGNIITRYLLGVRPLKAGYAEVLIAPQPASLTWMKGKVPTARGPVLVSWQSSPATLDFVIPAGSTAHVVLPVEGKFGKNVIVNGIPTPTQTENGAAALDGIPAGHYLITPGG